MEVINLEGKYNNCYFNCLEEWSKEMAESGDLKEKWFDKFKDKGLRVKLARNEQDEIVGMIQYMPAELSFVSDGEGYYIIKCIWVHGYKEGVGNNQKHGIGTLLLEAAEKDMLGMNLRGILSWGVDLPFWMKASWFKKHGYKRIDKYKGMVLMVKSDENTNHKPRFIRNIKIKEREKDSNKVEILIFKNGWCPANNIVVMRTLRAIKEFEDYIDVIIFDTTDRDVFLEYGIYDGVYINGKNIQSGPPPSYKKIFNRIKKAVKKVN